MCSLFDFKMRINDFQHILRQMFNIIEQFVCVTFQVDKKTWQKYKTWCQKKQF